jgi:hypothetical protein
MTLNAHRIGFYDGDYRLGTCTKNPNPAHGSVRIVQILSTNNAALLSSRASRAGETLYRSDRKDLKHSTHCERVGGLTCRIDPLANRACVKTRAVN